MRRLWIVLVCLLVLCVAGCGNQESAGAGETGSYFTKYGLNEYGDGWSVIGTARVEDGLAVLELENAWREPLAVDMVLSFEGNDEGFRLYYVTEDGEERLWTVGRNDVAEGVQNLGTSLSNTLEVAPGKSRLELRPLDEGQEEAAELDFELRLRHEGGGALSAKMPDSLENGLAGQPGLAEQPDGFKSVTGDYFAEYTMTEIDDGWLVSGRANLEQGLTLVELENAGAEPLALDAVLNYETEADGFEVRYVMEDGGVQAWLIDLDLAKDGVDGVFGKTLYAAPGKSRLELWPLGNAAADIDFELILTPEEVDGLSVKRPFGLEELEGGLPDIGDNSENKNGCDRTQYVSVSGIEVELAAGESRTLLEFAPEAKCRLNLQANLYDIKGDLTLVYVGPDGKERQLWSREARPESEEAKVIYGDGVSMPIELEPGEGRLEWRSEAGASFEETLLWDGVDKAGVQTLGI